ncbi:MmcQ/YjbR family DNA-binding protein [Lederbergia citri]|uniref:MmcQ/YjbR family DNA-binding protein n=1 Tax=Lederbergia citri TaxID=2833580 RepID=A0A942THM1_9BACI|nr:MmcQ/YjbR family DNA-binding protein [Lederbergia citri]MBS4196936.1 MmcQ/YjbR family DNA-binding protein [Lederbergia citri]
MNTVENVRAFVISLPEVEERDHWGKPSFRVRNKIFVTIQEDGTSLIVKTTQEDRMVYTELDPSIFSVPTRYSNLNYMVVRLDLISQVELRGLLIKGWSLVAPKSLVNNLDVKSYLEPGILARWKL